VRRAARIDDNQKEIVTQLRAQGLSVYSTSSVGDGFPDLLVGAPNYCKLCGAANLLIEIKNPKQSPSQRKLTKLQSIFATSWKGRKPIVVETVTEALEATDARNG